MRRQKLLIILFLIIALAGFISCGGAKTAPNIFAGKYSGTFSGASSGTWNAEIGKDGAVSAVMVDPDIGQFKLAGTISPTGDLACGGGVAEINRVSWEGTFKIENNVCTCSGGWKSSTGPFGSWEGQRE